MNYNFPLAFCRIPYTTPNGVRILVWNSRDGFVPDTFKMGGETYIRQNLFAPPKPEHEPAEGEYLFRDLSREEIQRYLDEAEQTAEGNRTERRNYIKTLEKKLSRVPIVVRMVREQIPQDNA